MYNEFVLQEKYLNRLEENITSVAFFLHSLYSCLGAIENSNGMFEFAQLLVAFERHVKHTIP